VLLALDLSGKTKPFIKKKKKKKKTKQKKMEIRNI
jgi:hypothetical protein